MQSGILRARVPPPNIIRNMIYVGALLAKRKQSFTMVSNKDDIDTAMQLQLFQSIH